VIAKVYAIAPWLVLTPKPILLLEEIMTEVKSEITFNPNIQTKAKPAPNKEVENFEEKQIAELISTLPYPGFPLVAGITPEQLKMWHSLKFVNKLVAECMEANRLFENDPIAWLKSESKEHRFLHRLVWSKVYWYKALWDLVQQGFCYVREEIRDLKRPFYFLSAFDLIVATIKEQQNDEFLSFCQQFKEFNIPQIQKYYKLFRKSRWSGLTPQEETELKRLNAQDPGSFLIGAVYHSCKRAAQSDETLKIVFKAFDVKAAAIADANFQLIEDSRKGRLNIKILSFAMLNGELVKRRKGAS
jgi:hypothetical protein